MIRSNIAKIWRSEERITKRIVRGLIREGREPMIFKNAVKSLLPESLDLLKERVLQSTGRLLEPFPEENIVSGERNLWSNAYFPMSSLEDCRGQARLDLEHIVAINDAWTDAVSLEDSAVFVTSKHLRTPLHSDERDALLCHLAGRKRVVIFDPKTSDRFPSRLQQLLTLRSTSGTHNSIYNAQNKLLRGQRYFSFDLEPGDALFLPKRWLHDIESLTQTISFALRLHL